MKIFTIVFALFLSYTSLSQSFEIKFANRVDPFSNSELHKIKLNDFFEYSSINYAMDTLPKKEEFILVLELLDDNKAISISDLEKISELSNKDLIEVLIVLLKYGYISVESD